MIFNIFKKECTHTKVSLNTEEAYCPDCGALIKNKWFLIRCSCCGIKRKASIFKDSIRPETKFCENCGEEEFIVQELESLNFIDIRYAFFKKTVINQKGKEFYCIWTDDDCSAEHLSASEKKIPVINKNERA